MIDPDVVPDLLTIEEAARVLRIGRTAAYEQAGLWRKTAGDLGIPNIAVGGQFRVPRAALEAKTGYPITRIPRGRDRRRPAAGGEVHELEPRRAG